MVDRRILLLAKEAFGYVAIDLLVYGSSYLALRLQLLVLPPALYAIITEFYGSYIALLVMVYPFAMDMAYFRFMVAWGETATFNLIVTVLLALGGLFSSLLFGLVGKIAPLVGYGEYKRYFYYAIVIVILDTALLMPYARLRASKQWAKFFRAKSLQSIGGVVCTLLWVYGPVSWNRQCVDGVFLSNICANVFTLILLFSAYRGVKLSWDNDMVKQLMGYASTLFWGMLCLRMGEILPRFLFNIRIGQDFYLPGMKAAMLGNLGVSYKLTLVATVVIKAFKYAAEPFFLSHATQSTKLYRQTLHLFLLTGSMGLSLLSLNIPWLAQWLIGDAAYTHAIDLVPYLASVSVILGVYYNLSIAFKLSNKGWCHSLVSGLGMVVTGLSSWVLLPKFAHWGCVYASMSGAIVMVCVGYYYAKKHYPIHYSKYGIVVLTITISSLHKVKALGEMVNTSYPIGGYIILNGLVIFLFWQLAKIRPWQ